MKIQKLDVPFAQVPNELLVDPRVSMKAKGLWSYIQSKPDDYDFSSERIVEETKDGVDSIKSSLVELEETGYLQRSRQQSGRVDYILIFPKVENPTGGISPQGNIPSISKKDNISSNILNNSNITYTGENPVKPVVESREFFQELSEKGQKFSDLVSFISTKYQIAPAFIAEELVAFCNYWTESNHSGTKQRWQLQKTFEPKRRLVTWFKNKRDWKSGRTAQPNKYQVENI